MFTCIENNLAKFQNGKLPRSFNGFLSKIRDDAETTKYWKLKKQRPNRRFLSRSIDYCVAKDVKLDLRTSGTCFHRHEVAYFQFCRAKGCNIINNKRIKNSVGTLWSIILRIDDFGENTKILFTAGIVNTHTKLLLVNQHTDIFENRPKIIFSKSSLW